MKLQADNFSAIRMAEPENDALVKYARALSGAALTFGAGASCTSGVA